MKHIIIASLFLFVRAMAPGQAPGLSKAAGVIKGTVLDSASGTQIEYATISLFKTGELKPVNGAVCNKKGEFTIKGLLPGSYDLKIDYIGYRNKTVTWIDLTVSNPVADLGPLHINNSYTVMAAAVVTSRTSLIENRIDKVVYNAEKDVTTQGAVAADLLRKIPDVSVDLDGNVQLQGNSNIRFLINGKPSAMFGNSVADALQAIPASMIKTVEVITSPGARYDAEGTGGIINIILKSSGVQGYNGSVTTSFGTRLENGTMNFNARKKGFGVHFNVSANTKLKSSVLTELERNTQDTASKANIFLHQDGVSNLTRKSMDNSAGFDWAIGKHHTLSGEAGYDFMQYTGGGYSNQIQTMQYTGGNYPDSSFSQVRTTGNTFTAKDYSFHLDYKKTFAKQDRELSFSIQSEQNHSGIENYQYQYPTGRPDSVFAGTISNNPGLDRETNISLDYTEPLKEDVQWESGLKTVIQRIGGHADVLSFDQPSGKYNYDPFLSNSLQYNRNIYAAYSSLSYPVTNSLMIKLGARYERTENKVSFSNAANVSTPGYGSFVPSAFIAYQFSKKQTLKLSYNRRISRPDYRELNPFINTSDPKNISAGNPGLVPELGTRMELGYNQSFENESNVSVSFFLRRSNRDIQPYVVYYPAYKVGDSVFNNVNVSIPQNIGLENVYGISLTGSVPLFRKLTVRGNTNLFFKHINNGFVAGNSVTSFNYRINLNATWEISKLFFAEFFGNFNSPRNEVQGRYPSFTIYSLALKKQVFHKKGSVGFTTTKPFNNYLSQNTLLTGQNFTANSYRRIAYRSFGISFSYKFGQLQLKKEKEEPSDKENTGGEN